MNNNISHYPYLTRQHKAVIGFFLLVTILLTTDLRAQGAISVRGGNQTLNITTGMAGSEPIPVVNTGSTIRYRAQAKISKITVRTVCVGQHFTLKVLATGVTQGVPAPEVTLSSGMVDTDFITNIPTNATFNQTNVTLQYTASATFAQGNSADLGNDVHTVTYTILAQ
jgi:hypothetical protein